MFIYFSRFVTSTAVSFSLRILLVIKTSLSKRFIASSSFQNTTKTEMSGRGNYFQKSANILKHLFKRPNYPGLFQYFSISDTGYTVSNTERLGQTFAIEPPFSSSNWVSNLVNQVGIGMCTVIIPLVPGLLHISIVIINA